MKRDPLLGDPKRTGRPRKNPLTDADILALIRKGRARGLTYIAIGDSLGWKPARVIARLRRADSGQAPKFRRHEWTQAEEDYLLDTWSTLSSHQQADHLGLDYRQVQTKMRDFRKRGMIESGDRAFGRPWSDEDSALLARFAPDYTIRQLAQILHRTDSAIEQRLSTLQIYSGTNLYRRNSVEKMFGVSRWLVGQWVKLGWLKMHSGSGLRYAHKFFHFNDLREFVRTHPYAYDWPCLKGTPLEVDAVRAMRDPWVSLQEAARLIGISHSNFRHYYANQIPSAIQVPAMARTGMQWRFKLSDIQDFKENHVPYRNHPIRGPRQVA